MNPYLILAGDAGTQFIAHFSDRLIQEEFGPGWAELLKYTIGVMLNAPFLHLLMVEYGIPKRTRQLVMLLYFITFFFGALGCLGGWVARPSRKGKLATI